MPLKLNVGLSKKIGLPDYGSLGASCHIELELEQSLVFSDLDGFHDKVRQAFVACNQAVKDELYRQQPEGGGAASCAVPGNGRGSDPCLHGQRPPREQMRPATASQIKAIVAIANRQQVDLPELLWNDYGVSRAEELTITEASRLIDVLKAPRSNGATNGYGTGEVA